MRITYANLVAEQALDMRICAIPPCEHALTALRCIPGLTLENATSRLDILAYVLSCMSRFLRNINGLLNSSLGPISSVRMSKARIFMG